MRIEVDSLPSHFYEQSIDWSGLSLTGFLARPLFREKLGRSIETCLLEKAERKDERMWEFSVDHSGQWNTGEPITAQDVCRQINAVGRSKGVSRQLVYHLKSVKTISDRDFQIITRIPMAHLPRLLSNPAFSPRHKNDYVHNVSSGDYYISTLKPGILTLKSSRQDDLIELVAHEEGKDSYQSGHVDISGPMTIAPDSWKHLTQAENARIFKLDIMYALDVPNSFLNISAFLAEAMNRNEICASMQGMISPCDSFCDFWRLSSLSAKNKDDWKIIDLPDIKEAQILYTGFAGNKEIAHAVSKQLTYLTGTKTYPTLVNYSNLLSGNCNREAFKIILLASLWPHPLSMLTPFRFSSEANDEFIQAYDASMNEQNLQKALVYADMVEKILSASHIGIIPLGRVHGCMRSRIRKQWYPPSGWMDARQLQRE